MCEDEWELLPLRVSSLVETAPPPLAKLVLVGAVSAILGLLCVRATIGDPPPGSRAGMAVGPTLEEEEEEEEAPTVDPASDAPAQPGDEEPKAPEIEPDLEPDLAVAVEPESEAVEPEPPPSAPTAPATPSDFTFRRGRLAYLRCVGLESGAGRCPRDTSLEETVWGILENVGACPGVVAGSADVRLHMGAGATELRFRDFGGRPIEAGVLSACLNSQMARLRTDLRSADLIVSFRFEIGR